MEIYEFHTSSPANYRFQISLQLMHIDFFLSVHLPNKSYRQMGRNRVIEKAYTQVKYTVSPHQHLLKIGSMFTLRHIKIKGTFLSNKNIKDIKYHGYGFCLWQMLEANESLFHVSNLRSLSLIMLAYHFMVYWTKPPR